MKVLPQYILRQTVVTLFMTVSVFTFVLMLGGVLRQLSERNVSLSALGMFLGLTLPSLLSFTLPMAMLATALLVFGRLSADHELTALRASGISLGQVAAPVILLAVALSGLCFYINATLGPICKFQVRTLVVRLGLEQPLDLLEEGRYLKEFPGYVIYIGRKLDRAVADIVIFTLDEDGRVTSSFRARRGTVSVRRETNRLLLDLEDVRGDLRDPGDPLNPRKIRAGTTAQRYPVELDLGRILRKARTGKKLSDYTLPELVGEIRQLQARGLYPAAALVEAHQRATMAVACLSFTLIGIPLGVKTSRRETSIGIALSLALAFLFYFVVITANAVKDRPTLFPEAILWMPNLIFTGVGLALLWRLSRA